MNTEEKIKKKFKLDGMRVEILLPEFDGHEVYMAVPEGGTEEQPLYVGIPMVFLVKGEVVEEVDSDMALMLMGKVSDDE